MGLRREGTQGSFGAGAQVRSYALWVLPTYFVVTDGRLVSVWDFQGAIAPDREVVRVNQGELADKFDELYSRLNPLSAVAARQSKLSRLERP